MIHVISSLIRRGRIVWIIRLWVHFMIIRPWTVWIIIRIIPSILIIGISLIKIAMIVMGISFLGIIPIIVIIIAISLFTTINVSFITIDHPTQIVLSWSSLYTSVARLHRSTHLGTCHRQTIFFDHRITNNSFIILFVYKCYKAKTTWTSGPFFKTDKSFFQLTLSFISIYNAIQKP